MIFFDRFIFAVENRFNSVINRVNNQNRQQQFAMFVNSYEIITLFFHFVDSTRTTFKRFFNDVINIVNNDVASKKRRKRFLESKDDQRAFSVNAFAFYQFIFFEFVVVRFRQEIRRFARLASRAFSSFQFLSQKKNDDHDFDDFSFIRSYADFVDHESNRKSEHVSNHDDNEEKNSRLLNRKSKKTYAKKIVKQRVRIRKTDFKTRRDDKSLNFDYMIVRKKDVIFDKHVLSKLQNKNDNNVCSFCDVYQYFEKCHRKLIDDKY